MFIIVFVISVVGFNPDIQFTNEQEISMFPTIGENYEFYLSYLKEPQLTCKLHPQIPNVKLLNQCEEIQREKGNQFISMSSNYTHFSTLAKQNEITLYQWKNSKFQQVGESLTIDASFNCFNINLSENFAILVDCYQNKQFFLIQFIDGQQIIAYKIQSTVPTSTKIQSIVNGTNAFIVYAQYFKKYSIISLLTSQFQNSSSLNNQFVDFDIPNTISPNIYAITSSEIYQLQISPDSQYYIQYQFSQSSMNNFNAISAFYNIWTYSQCDQIQLSYLYHSKSMTAPLLGCEKIIIKIGIGIPTQSGQPIQKMLQSEQFIVYQSLDTIMISQQKTKEHFSYRLNHSNNSLLYFNQDNELFSFNSDIIVYKITRPIIQVNLTNLQVAGNNYTFKLICKSLQQGNCTYTYSNFYLQVLPENDTNIYVMFNQDYPQYQTSLNYSAYNYFNSFSGQLLHYAQNQNEPYFYLQKITFQNVGKVIQNYHLAQIFSINYPFVEKQYLIGYDNETLNFVYCYYSNQNNSYYFTTLTSINISVNAKSLKLAYSIEPTMIISGLNTNDTIYLFQSQNNSNIYDITLSNYTFDQQFQDFVITYNSIIILILNQEINIMTLNFTNTFSLNQESINNLFENIQFNPIQIAVNAQLQSSLLYINNINEVIIFSIDQNCFPIPISLIQVDFKIKQINLVNQLLILSYTCNKGQNICFSVWNVENLPNYYYQTHLQWVQFDNNIIIQSDNLFFYVNFSNYTVYVYNPQLPYHMSLYYMLQLTSPIQCSESFYLSLKQQETKSIVISNSNVYFLLVVQGFSLTSQEYNYEFNNSISYPLFIYNFTVTSAQNETSSYQTPNQSITSYSNFTVFQNQSNISIQLTQDYIIPESKNFTYPMNLILDRQVSCCQIINIDQKNEEAQYCKLTPLSYNSTKILNFQNYSLITSINNEFFALQNCSYIQTITSDLDNKFNLNYEYLNLSECLKSTCIQIQLIFHLSKQYFIIFTKFYYQMLMVRQLI
ncbi:unnamed protein product (macronuclear) [Paramecium tetraurelia]|uniref:Transmembrane protein n=1 Tax=Paramecium tetraurelia TaxID=5888 RepID=A0D8D2_PARTE|nr:uncharacterized protein GSPATT00039317001 [Paramecium tetraurelia]CAK79299.1 unnamed protein product [Paramecium tetraurelia]|eukprot:XP_001446696.1 hypothetical protein (macronuclear) [Paramecium tetraurelia strain d4-2]